HDVSRHLMGLMMGRRKLSVAERSSGKLKNKPGMHAMGDPPGLYLSVDGNGGRSWILRYSFAGRRRDMGLGSCIDFSLAEARERAREQRKLALQGIDPIDARRQADATRRLALAKSLTFAQCVDGYIDSHGDSWKNGKHRAEWRNRVERYAGPVIGSLNVAQVDTGLVLKVLEPLWREKTETASRLRGRIERVLAWATVRGYRSGENPARW